MAGVNNGRFKKGQHWRKPRQWWDREWLQAEYVERGKSAAEIASAGGCTENNILFWLGKHGIPRRSMREVRQVKRWGAAGEKNPMYGKRGILNPRWRGGLTPFRQAVYSTTDWRVFVAELRKRDPVCRLCGSSRELQIHHIEPVSRAPLLIMAIGNVLRLCGPCHRKMTGTELRWRKRLFRLLEKVTSTEATT